MSNQLHFLKRNIPFSSTAVVKGTLYKSLVLSVSVYASPVWYASIYQLQCFERVQRRAIKWILRRTFENDISYAASLVQLNILPFAYLKVFNDLCMLNSILNGRCSIESSKFCINIPPPGNRSNKFVQFTLPKTKKHTTDNNFFVRVVKYANPLLRRSVDFWVSPSVFRRNLRKLFIAATSDFGYYLYPATWDAIDAICSQPQQN
jgi:hypothetical protein